MPKRITLLFSSVLILLLSAAVVTAQTSCAALLQDALEAVDTNCGGTGRNEACYGYDQVEASFVSEVGAATFSQPQDIASLIELVTIRTVPLNLETGQWGVAVMNIQADLPNTLPGQSVTFVLLGDVELENAVAPDDAFIPGDGIEVTVAIAQGANIRSGPGANFNVLGGAGFEETLLADGVSQDGEWLRVIYRERPAWVNRVTLVEDPAIDTLPSLTDDVFTPMQAFYLRTGVGEPQCDEAPGDVLMVQGPENIEVSLNVNGADINLGSTGLLRVVEIDGQSYLEIIVIDGEFEIGGQVIRPGQRSIILLGENEEGKPIVIGEPSPPEPVDPGQFGEDWCTVERLPLSLLNYEIEILCPGETLPTPVPIITNTGNGTTPAGPVSCNAFAITAPPEIVATDFILQWTPVQGAASYEVAGIDSAGNQIYSMPGIVGNSTGVNGGNFPPSGSVHVRAFDVAGNYLCFAAKDYAARVPDPNEPIGGYGQLQEEQFSATLGECRFEFFGEGYEVLVSWQNATEPVTVTVFGGSPETFTAPSASGLAVFAGFSPPEGVNISSGSSSFNFACPELPN